MNCRLSAGLALVLVVCVDLCSVGCQPAGKNGVKLGVFKDISDRPIIYKPEQLFDILGFSLEAPLEVGVVDILAATDNKNQENTIANKYSINDLLAMNEVYESDFTPEKFKQKLAFCASLSPDHVKKPNYGFAFYLMRHDLYINAPKTYLEVQTRKPQKYVFYKNLYEYCVAAFDYYHNLLRHKMRVDTDLDKRLMQLEEDVGKFRQDHLQAYRFVNKEDYLLAKDVMVDFINSKNPDEALEVNNLCSELIRKVGFVAERPLHRHKWAPIRYDLVFTYCMGALSQE